MALVKGLCRLAQPVRSRAVTQHLGRNLCLLQNASVSSSLHWREFSTGSDDKDGKTLERTPSFMNISMQKLAGQKTAEDAVNNILYNLPQYDKAEKRHILSVFVDNEAGVLSKVSGLLSARGFNIDSLSVANTDVSDLSRMTIVLKGPDEQIEQAKRQLTDLCDVWAVFDYKTPENTFERELLLVKVNCVPPQVETSEFNILDENDQVTPKEERSYEDMMAIHFHRQAILDVAKLFGGTATDIGSEHVIIELVSWSSRVDACLNMLRPYGVVEAARTGVIAMGRSKVLGGPETGTEDDSPVIDLADLPPS